ncbi:diacylglycerol lipase-alpha isoform X2 [Teleopsis dalmanni]|uniref:diacylglycerol lipase-alpha isoform X2 n=1 Tax=Teleopsis dalmanni TaxID=139649 RepID=UPI0018CD55CD|nr:diacylglycerol lipase-alpha isoform X2 [Teleopsis dalmanni]
MPGLVVFRRRWSVGSDDLVVPGAFLLAIHFICFIVVLVSLVIFEYNTSVLSIKLLFYHLIGYVIILFISICVEIGICIISMRGSILDSGERATINLWIYIKSLVIFFDITWLVLGTIWLANYYIIAPIDGAKKTFIAIIICNWTLVFMTLITIWCTFDTAGRSWVKMKKYQRSMRETESRFNYKRSGSMNRNWRQRKVMRAYQDSWDHRCRLLFCCMGSSERNRNSFTDIARLLSDFFRELDVVPSDVVAGLVLLRKFQKLEREAIVRQRKNGTYEFLSGVPITERTQFLALNDAKSYDFFQTVIHYMYFAQGAYGWPMYFIINRTKLWHLVPELKCFGCCCKYSNETEIIQDNCCYCNYAALKKTLQVGDIEIVYATYHVDVGETPFFVAIDYTRKKIVVSIRGTLSMKDILTDLNAEGEVLPLSPPRDDWLGHKGMVQTAIYIRNKLRDENLIEKALNLDQNRNTHTFGLVLVGHSLGAGTAAILAILMKPDYPSLQCFSYSPPGGLLSMPAVEYSKSFITSVVLGKDLVPRIGLYQMEALRADLINAIQRSIDPKWKTISCVICCGCGPEPTSVVEMSGKDTHINQYQEQRDSARSTSAHPTDSSIALTLHQPLYPPGRIIHIVRHHPKPNENVLKSREPVYQAIWADSTDFDEVLISPVMLQDHMPDKILAALKKVVTTSGPRKPQRQTSNAFSTTSNEIESEHVITTTPLDYKYINNQKPAHSSCSNLSNVAILTPTAQRKVCLETSFTNLQSPIEQNLANQYTNSFGGPDSSKASSIAGSLFGRSLTPYDISSVVDDSTTVTRRSPSVVSETATVIVNEPERLKIVAFDMNIHDVETKSPSPQMPPKGILQRQFSTRYEKKPKSSVIASLRRASDVPNPDVVQDDWLGLAPLASPETLSEISSISSRTSAPISLANSIERYLHNITINENGNKTMLEDIFESQLHTPKIMRRAPKFSENLATCAEDSKKVDQYKRMGRVFVTFPRLFNLNQQGSFDSSEESFESAQSLTRVRDKSEANKGDSCINNHTLPQKQNSKSADQLDEDTIQLEVPTRKLTFSDSEILSNDDCASNCPSCSCHNDDTTNKNICCRRSTHEQCALLVSSLGSNTTGSVDTTYYSANSSIEQFLTPARNVTDFISSNGCTNYNILNESVAIKPGVLESHFPVYYDDHCNDDKDVLLPSNHCSTTTVNITKPSTPRKDVVGGRVRKRLSSEEFIFTRADDLPLLVQIAEKSGCSSPMGRRRKGCVYPAESNVRIPQITTKFLSESFSKCSNNKNSESSV